ncbi:hypothetical protein ALC62_10180 [Cyphomyrmex costatus]|uniref:Uncharacterized protein n=1 Tax=Cyphomyrmex costatus TaxID=456900 RepID=A0A195CFH5_9HYME|nr:hypothetical protein ALC62_10180 [Cyphomyrmex costatus]
MDYGFGGALVLHVGRQRGDKNPVSQCIAVVVATTAAAAAAAAAVTGGVVRQAGGASGWQRVGVWLVPSFVRSGRREGRSDDPETEGAQSAVSRAETVTVTSVADVIIAVTTVETWEASRSAEVVTAKATGAITDKRSNRTVRERPLLLMGWTIERHGSAVGSRMTNGRPLGKVLCIAGGRASKFQGRLRRADLGVGQAEKQELRARSGALARGYRKP